MFVQREVYRNQVSMTFNETYELDLPKSGELIGVEIYVNSTQLASALVDVANWRLIDYITKIEVLANGSEPIKVLSGAQALASAYYDTGVIPTHIWRNYSSVPHRQNIPILFGRGYKDRAHRLDLKRFDTVQLKITNTATSTQFTTDVKATIILHWLREAAGAGNLGYYREEEWKRWVPVAGETEYSTLPVGLPIRRILLEAKPGKDANFQNVVSMGNLMSDIEFTLRTGQARVYKGSLDHLARLVHSELGFAPTVHCESYHSATKGFDVGIGYVTGNMGAPGTYAALAAYADTFLRDDNQDSSQYCNDRQPDVPINGVFRGLSFMHSTPLFWSIDPGDLDALDPTVDKDVKVDVLTAASATVTGSPHNSVILSRLVR